MSIAELPVEKAVNYRFFFFGIEKAPIMEAMKEAPIHLGLHSLTIKARCEDELKRIHKWKRWVQAGAPEQTNIH